MRADFLERLDSGDAQWHIWMIVLVQLRNEI
jgi:hypothetical protein